MSTLAKETKIHKRVKIHRSIPYPLSKRRGTWHYSSLIKFTMETKYKYPRSPDL